MTKVQYFTAASLDGFIADDAGLLDEIHVHLTPVVLGAGAPLLPRRITSSRLSFREGAVAGQCCNLILDVKRRDQG